MRDLQALIVEDNELLSQQMYENLRISLMDHDIKLTHIAVGTIERARESLTPGQTRYGLVIADMLWTSPLDQKPKALGLDVVKRAASTSGVVVVAVSVGDTQSFPCLEQEAYDAGAHVFKLYGALQVPAAWDRLAEDVVQHLPGAISSNARPKRQDPRIVMVIQGRDPARVDALYEFLRSLQLTPLEWSQLMTDHLRSGGHASAANLDLVRHGFERALGAIALFTPDDMAGMRAELGDARERDEATSVRGQARQNVLLETGYALCYAPARTILV